MLLITPHEYKMLKDGYHPEFESDDEQGVFVEQGKGSDIIYRKEIVRKSDNENLWFEYAHNSDGGFDHDEPRDGNFRIDYKKKDTLDPYDELNLNEPVLIVPEKPRTIQDDYGVIKDECVDFDFNDPILKPEEVLALFNENKKVKTMIDHKNFSHSIFKMAIKYKIEANSLRFSEGYIDSEFSKNKKGWLQKYTDKYKDKYNILTEIVIQGQIFKLNTKEIKKLRKAVI